MSLWTRLRDVFHLCPITLRDVTGEPGHDVPSLPASPSTSGHGTFREVNGVPVLQMAGTHREMGRQQGTLLGKHVRAFARHYLTSSLGRDPGAWTDLRRRATGCKEFIPDRYLDELNAIGGASGLPDGYLLGASVFLDFYSSVLCSCIAAGPERNGTGRTLVGRNLDFPSMGVAHRMTMLTVYEPDGYHSFVSLTWPGLIGVLTGMNEHGLTVALAEVDGRRPYGRGVPYTLMHRRLLEECRTVDEAESRLRSMPRTRSNNLLVADAAGAAAVLEYDRTRVVRRDAEDGWVHATNHFLSDEMPSKVLSFKHLSSLIRYHRIDRFRREHPSVRDEQLFELLSDVALGRLNLASMVLAPEIGRMRLKIGAPPAARRMPCELDLKSFFRNRESDASEGSERKVRPPRKTVE